MNKNVLIIKGSPRTKGNTATMADIFAKGAIENHNDVTEIVLKDKTIKIVVVVLFANKMEKNVFKTMI